jgi:hypothetical protein
MLEAHMAEGLSFKTFAAIVDVMESTIHLWVKDYPEFSQSKRRGEVACQMFWEKLGRDHILNVSESYGGNTGSKSVSLNAAVYRLNMANRFGWKDRIEHTGEVDMHGTRAKVNKLMKDPKTAEAARAVALALSEPEDKDDLPSGE